MEIIVFYLIIANMKEMMLYKLRMLQLYQKLKIYLFKIIHLIQLYDRKREQRDSNGWVTTHT